MLLGVFLCLCYYRQYTIYPIHRPKIGIGGGALDAVKGIAAAVKNAGDNSKSDKLRDAYTTQAGVQVGKLGYDVYKNNGAIAGAREALATAEASGNRGAIAKAQKGLENTVAALAPTLNISFSSQKSESESQEIVTESVVSSNTAQNGTTRYIATGEKDADGNIIEGTGDVTTFGTQVDSQNILVDANNEVNLLPGGNSIVTSSSNSSSGFSVGGSLGVGVASVNASINKGNGSGAGNEQSYTGSNFNASDNLTIKSGGDTNIIGSVVSGNSVTTDINGNLNIESLQDTKTFNSEQNDKSVGASYNFATNTVGGSYSNTTATVKGNSASVQGQQAGIYAGEGGLQGNVDGKTTLVGGVLSSTADIEKNTFTTGEFESRDLENFAEWEANQSGTNIGLSSDISAVGNIINVGKQVGMGALGGKDRGENDSGTSYTTVTDNINITVTSDAETGEDSLAGVNRDASLVNTGTVAIDEQAMMESQELMTVQGDTAAAAAQVGFEAAGDIAENLQGERDPETGEVENPAWAEGGINRAILHAGVGGVVSQLGGENVLAGMGAAAVNQLAQPLINKILDDKGLIVGSAERKEIEQAISAGLGALVSAGDANAAQVANDATEFNRQLHFTEADLIRENADDFALELGLCSELSQCTEQDILTAQARLTETALSLIDAGFRLDSEDEISLAFLNKMGAGTTIEGTDQTYFQATDQQRNDIALNSQYLLSNKDVYDAVTQHGQAYKPYADAFTNALQNSWEQVRNGEASSNAANDYDQFKETISELSDEDVVKLISDINYQNAGSLTGFTALFPVQEALDGRNNKDELIGKGLRNTAQRQLEDSKRVGQLAQGVIGKVGRGERLSPEERAFASMILMAGGLSKLSPAAVSKALKGIGVKSILKGNKVNLETKPKINTYPRDTSLTSQQKSEIKQKIKDRTATKEEVLKLNSDRRFDNRRTRGVARFWREEKNTLKNGGAGSRNWTPEQKLAILNNKTPKYNGEAIQGHHKYNAKDYPHLADDPKNIQPVTVPEHLYKWHGGNFQNETKGVPLNPLFKDNDF